MPGKTAGWAVIEYRITTCPRNFFLKERKEERNKETKKETKKRTLTPRTHIEKPDMVACALNSSAR